jgi:hypothetical protein
VLSDSKQQIPFGNDRKKSKSNSQCKRNGCSGQDVASFVDEVDGCFGGGTGYGDGCGVE